jgi:WD40 repeat protein
MTSPVLALPLAIVVVCGPFTATAVRSAENSPLFALAVSPDAGLVAAGGERGLVIIRELGTGAKLHTLNIGKPIYGLAFSPDGQLLAVACRGQSVDLWTVRDHEFTKNRSLKCRGDVLAVAFSPSGGTLAAGVQGSGNIHLFDVPAASLRCTIWEPSNLISSLAFTPDGKTLASAGANFKLWDVQPEVLAKFESDRLDLTIEELRANGKRSLKWESDFDLEYAAGIAVAPDGKWLATVTGIGGPNTGGKTLSIWDVTTGRRLKKIASLGMTTVAITPKGKCIVTGSDDGTIRVWDAETGKQQRQWMAHPKAVRAIALVTGSDQLVTAGADGTFKLWDWSAGELKRNYDASPEKRN